MSLLVDMMRNSLDEAYADRAATRGRDRQRAATGGPGGSVPPDTVLRRVVGVVLLVALGLMTGTAIGHVRERASALTGLRGGLLDEARQRTQEGTALERRRDELRAEVDAARRGMLGQQAARRAADERLTALRTVAGTVPVTGPGLVVTVDDAPAAGGGSEGRGGAFGDGRVLDRDLQALANGLWSAGAEAVAVDGQRLTSLSAIRAAGEAVLVDFRPVSPPYVVEAVGDPAALEVAFRDGDVGRRFATWSSLYGLGFEVRRDDALELPAADPRLRHAEPAVPAAPASGDRRPDEGGERRELEQRPTPTGPASDEPVLGPAAPSSGAGEGASR